MNGPNLYYKKTEVSSFLRLYRELTLAETTLPHTHTHIDTQTLTPDFFFLFLSLFVFFVLTNSRQTDKLPSGVKRKTGLAAIQQASMFSLLTLILSFIK